MVWNAFLEDEEVQALIDEIKCPECNNSEIAEIVWGYIDINAEVEKLHAPNGILEMESKRLGLNG